MKHCRSHQNFTNELKRGGGESSGDNDVDEKVGGKAAITLSHGSRSFKKPSSNSSDVNQLDKESAYTGKSFYNCPQEQEETKKNINRSSKPNLQSCGMKTPMQPSRFLDQDKSTFYAYKEFTGKPSRALDMIEKASDGSLVQRRILDEQSSGLAPSVNHQFDDSQTNLLACTQLSE